MTKSIINDVKFDLNKIFLNMFDHKILNKNSKYNLTRFSTIAYLLSNNKKFDKFDNLMQILLLSVNDKIYKNSALFFNALKKCDPKKYKFSAIYIYLIKSDSELIYKLKNKSVIKSNILPVVMFQSNTDLIANIITKIPASLESDFVKFSKLHEQIAFSNLSKPIQKLFESNKCSKFYFE